MSNATDGLVRCAWATSEPIYTAYHDDEWGVPKTGDQAFYEKLVLEGFQAGLSWITILRKREHFRKVFDNFDAKKIVRYGDTKIAELMGDAGIIRNRAKIEATISNAKALLEMQQSQSLSKFLWDFVDGTPQQNSIRDFSDIPAQTPTSAAIAKALKAKGFRFCGPTTVYAFMQSVGMVNDHLLACHRHAACAELGAVFAPPTD